MHQRGAGRDKEMKHEITDEQESELGDLEKLYGEVLQGDINVRTEKFNEDVTKLRVEMLNDIKYIHARTEGELKEEIRELKERWSD